MISIQNPLEKLGRKKWGKKLQFSSFHADSGYGDTNKMLDT
jgi:hypothetical protein